MQYSICNVATTVLDITTSTTAVSLEGESNILKVPALLLRQN